MPKAECVVFNGVKFRRYPDSPHLSVRRYFQPPPHAAMRGVESLHREVWKHHRGPIPPGHHVHHKDGDPGNNDISNLECLPSAEHLRLHGSTPLTPARLALLESIRPLTKEWHASPEGLAWHSEHGRKTWTGRDPVARQCGRCGAEYKTLAPQRTVRFCSNACRAGARRDAGADNESRSCARCGTAFATNRYGKQRFCSRSCSSKAARSAA